MKDLIMHKKHVGEIGEKYAIFFLFGGGGDDDLKKRFKLMIYSLQVQYFNHQAIMIFKQTE